MKKKGNLVWLDLEMTGLDPRKDRIIEIATVITDKDLHILAEGPVFAIHQSDALLDGMDDWCTKTHGKSGLTERVKTSKVTEAEAEATTLQFISQYVDKNQSPLCGNSISQDRRFLDKYMPTLEDYFHYRLIDVSTIKELARRWQPKLYKGFDKTSKHQALDDIKDSIDELTYYRTHWLKV